MMRRTRLRFRMLPALPQNTGAWAPALAPQEGFVFARAGEAGGREHFIGSAIAERISLSPRKHADFSAWLEKLETIHEETSPGSPPFLPLIGGYFGFEAIRHWEELPSLGCLPGWNDVELLFARDVLRCDARGTWIGTRSFDGDLGGKGMEKRLDALERRVEQARKLKPPPIPRKTASRKPVKPGKFEGLWGSTAFEKGFSRVRKHITEGDVFQCVLSDRMNLSFSEAQWEEAHSDLFQGTPSPYQAFYRSKGKRILSTSPERLISVSKGRAETHPIAGTRPRGKNAAEDRRMVAQLRASPKELAEHIMLVDLGRNDLGKVAIPGSVHVREFLTLQKLARVQHLVSVVEAKLPKGLSPWRVLQAAFPAGTLSGAPKLRAIEILSGLEPVARGPYGGAIVIADTKGTLDSCILIRSLFGEVGKNGKGKAWVQAGAGIVYDSRASREYAEIDAKSRGIRELVCPKGKG